MLAHSFYCVDHLDDRALIKARARSYNLKEGFLCSPSIHKFIEEKVKSLISLTFCINDTKFLLNLNQLIASIDQEVYCFIKGLRDFFHARLSFIARFNVIDQNRKQSNNFLVCQLVQES